MSTMTFTQEITLEKITCPDCTGVFAMNAEKLAFARKHSGGYFCPYCGQQRGWWKSEAQKRVEELEVRLKREMDQMSIQLAGKQAAERRAANAEAALARSQKRAKAGVCPCCHRTFKQLAAHMKSKHPQEK